MVMPFTYEFSLSRAVDKPLKTGVEAVHIGSVSLDGVGTHALIERRHGEEVDPRPLQNLPSDFAVFADLSYLYFHESKST